MSGVRRWDGATREVTDWNELRRDSELFFPQGTVSVYLYSQGVSRRGPSFRIPYGPLLYAGSRFLVQESLMSTLTDFPYDDPESSPESDEFHLYLPAPDHLSRSDCFDYHITTRNFFAWLMGVPLVGFDPTSALLALKQRMDDWRDADCDNLKSICDYICQHGYGEMAQFGDQSSPAPTRQSHTSSSQTLHHGDYSDALTRAVKHSGEAVKARQRSKALKKQVQDCSRPVQSGHRHLLSVHFSLPDSDLVAIPYENTLPAMAPYLY